MTLRNVFSCSDMLEPHLASMLHNLPHPSAGPIEERVSVWFRLWRGLRWRMKRLVTTRKHRKHSLNVVKTLQKSITIP